MFKKKTFFHNLAYGAGGGTLSSFDKSDEDTFRLKTPCKDSSFSIEKKCKSPPEKPLLEHHDSFFDHDSDFDFEEDNDTDRDSIALNDNQSSIDIHETLVKLADSMLFNIFPDPYYKDYTRKVNEIFKLQEIQKQIEESEKQNTGIDDNEYFSNPNKDEKFGLSANHDKAISNANNPGTQTASESKTAIYKTRHSLMPTLSKKGEQGSSQNESFNSKQTDTSTKFILKLPRSAYSSQSINFIIDENSEYKTPSIMSDYIVYDWKNLRYENINENEIQTVLQMFYDNVDKLNPSFKNIVGNVDESFIEILKELRKLVAILKIQRAYRESITYKVCSYIRKELLVDSKNPKFLQQFANFLEKSKNNEKMMELQKSPSDSSSTSPRSPSQHQESLIIQRVGEGIKKSPHITYSYPPDLNEKSYLTIKATNYDGFRFKEYAPHIFSKLRSFWGIDQSDYQKELGSESISILSQNAGRSGSYFLMSESKKYMLKSMTVTEFRLLFNELLKDYTSHMIINRSSLLTRYLGLYLVKWQNMGRVHRVYFLAMNNVFEKGMPEEVYDLKGSTVNRTVLKHGESPRQGLVMKDNDLQQNLNLMRPLNVLLLSQLEDDSKWLSHHGIMDYSLLLGIHTVERDDDTNTEPLIDDRDLSDGQSIFTQHNGGVYSSFGENKQLYCKYYIGIIDMLQEYDVNKKLERGIKLTMLGMKKYQTGGISSMGPKAYQARFMQFVKNHVAVGRKDIAAFSKRKRQQNDEDI